MFDIQRSGLGIHGLTYDHSAALLSSGHFCFAPMTNDDVLLFFRVLVPRKRATDKDGHRDDDSEDRASVKKEKRGKGGR